ncbi:MAG: PIG-L family deacetylase [Candidatus Omnitrophica bacterium]|nr:PIG-L family deacetylase [Candidatus Omnitrophota bacterium]
MLGGSNKIQRWVAAFLIGPGMAGFLFWGNWFKHLTAIPGTFKSTQTLTFAKDDRIMILAPHPDDEAIGCAGVIQQAVALGLPVKIVFLTYGDNNQWAFMVYRKHPVLMPKAVLKMGEVRHTEALEAARVLGVDKSQLIFLGYPDFGALSIWYARWGEDRPPARSLMTDAREVPYPDAYRPGAPYRGEEILKDLRAIIKDFRPTKIFVSHPGDHNPDHRALYLFARVAVWDSRPAVNAEIYPYLIHYAKWPLPRGRHFDKDLIPPKAFQEEIAWRSLTLSDGQVEKKLAALKNHQSQYRSSKSYLLTFVRPNELFGDFPVVALTQNDARQIPGFSREAVPEIPESFMDDERSKIVGMIERTAEIKEHKLLITVRLSRPLGKTVGVAVSVFGYREDVLFEKMPKIRVHLGALHYRVLDQNRVLPDKNIEVLHGAKEIRVAIPLELMGYPQKILTSAQTYLGNFPLDWTSWRILEVVEPAPLVGVKK